MASKVIKKELHPRNIHNGQYDFEALIKAKPKLKDFVGLNNYGNLSVNFSNPKAVLALNSALLASFYGIKNWSIPEDYLCPPIPGRVDYIHYIADLLASSNKGIIPSKNVLGLDIGVGANCIYPLLSNSIYKWEMKGSDIDSQALSSAQNILNENKDLAKNISLLKQENKSEIFNTIIKKEDYFDFVLCNPPFHKSKEEAQAGSKRKVQNLKKIKIKEATLNFGGVSNELWCKGGEVTFIKQMIKESEKYKKNVLWFTCLVSKKDNLHYFYKALDNNENILEYKTIEMKQGNKISRFIAWTYLKKEEELSWVKKWN